MKDIYYKDRRNIRTKNIHRTKVYSFFAAIVLCLVLICSFSYSALKTSANTGYKYYTSITVDYSDSLWGIAEEYADKEHYKDYNEYIEEVMHINHINTEDKIFVGQTLIIPYYSTEYVY